jgi:hypothetical protein
MTPACGARFDLRAVKFEESGLSPKEIWSNESQERYDGDCTESLAQFEGFASASAACLRDWRRRKRELIVKTAMVFHSPGRRTGLAGQVAQLLAANHTQWAAGPQFICPHECLAGENPKMP